jgi:acylphosphatase
MGKVARCVRITGRVQGVFFRGWTKDQAKKHDIAGWVRNCPDGSVEAHLEGEEAAVRWLIDLIYDGPGGSRVDLVQSKEAAMEGLSGFEIRH